MGKDFKRELEGSRLSSEPPTKKTKQLTSPKMYHWDIPGLKQDVYTPLPPSLPSPFAKGDFRRDESFESNMQPYGPRVRVAFGKFWNRPNINTIGESIRNSCDGEHIVWADPERPQIVISSEGMRLYVFDTASEKLGAIADRHAQVREWWRRESHPVQESRDKRRSQVVCIRGSRSGAQYQWSRFWEISRHCRGAVPFILDLGVR